MLHTGSVLSLNYLTTFSTTSFFSFFPFSRSLFFFDPSQNGRNFAKRPREANSPTLGYLSPLLFLLYSNFQFKL